MSRIALLLAAACALTVSLTLASGCGEDPYLGTWTDEKLHTTTVIEQGAGDSYIVHFKDVGNTVTFVPDGDKLSTGDRSQSMQVVDGKLKYWLRDVGADKPLWMVRQE